MANTPRLNTNVPDTFALATLDQDYDPPIRGFRTGASGNVSVQRLDGTSVVLPGLLAGETFKGMIKRINTSGTTVATPASNIVVFW